LKRFAFAVQAQKWLEQSREKDQRKKSIFYALMGTKRVNRWHAND